MSKKTLIVVAHPNIDDSRVNKDLLEHIRVQPNVTIHELYKKYPDYKIDIQEEQKLLLEHDNIVLQFPFYWYSMPPLLKQWMDQTFTYGFSHGIGGTKLKGKKFQVVTSTAMSQKHYSPILWTDEDKLELAKNTIGGSDGVQPADKPYMKPSLAQRYGLFIMDVFLTPLEQSIYHASMLWEPPFIVHSAIPEGRAFHAISTKELQRRCENYVNLVRVLNS